MLKKVLVLYASCGNGHQRAAEVTAEELRKAGFCGEVTHLDVLNLTSRFIRHVHHKTYFRMVQKLPALIGAIYDFSDKKKENKDLSLKLDRLTTRPFQELLCAEQPDLLVCTHFLPAGVAGVQRGKSGKKNFAGSVVTVVTDYKAHRWWRADGVDHYFVPTEEVRYELTASGIDTGAITASGIPISSEFTEAKDQHEMLRKYKFDSKLPTMLLTAGGEGIFEMGDLIKAVASLSRPVQAFVVCGRNAKVKREADRAVAELPVEAAKRFQVMGFTGAMDELMAASDILVGKPGGLTTSEVLARGIAFAVVNPIPGQEERNARFLLEAGAGVWCEGLSNVKFKLEGLISDPGHLARMKENARRAGKPFAAQTIVETLRRLYDR